MQNLVDDGIAPEAEPDIFEKFFGKKPEVGYEFTYLTYKICSSAIVFEWGCKGVGFGEYALIFSPEKGLDLDTECMSDDFGIALLDEAVKRIDNKQKAVTWADINLYEKCRDKVFSWFGKQAGYPQCMGYKQVDSKDGHEEFIKNICLAFKFFLTKEEIKNE